MKTIHFNGIDETIELILRTIIPVNQLSIYGALADLCEELARDSSGAGKPAANENLESMVIPTEFPTSNPISQTDAEVHRKLLREYQQRFAELLEQPNSAPTLFFRRILEKDSSSLHLMKKDTLPRSEETSHVRGWIRGNTKIGPVLDLNVCYHQGRYGVEIMIESLF